MSKIPGYETTREAAERAGVTDSRIRQLAIAGEIPGAVKVAGIWLVPEGVQIKEHRRGRPRRGGRQEK